MADNFSLKPILMFFIVIIMGVVFLQILADNQIENTELSNTFHEQITITSGAGQTNNDDVVSLQFFGNGSVNTDQSNIVLGEVVNFTKPGVITVSQNNGNFSNGNYNISYTYEGDLYVVDTKSHPLLNLMVIFFVFVIIAMGITALNGSSEGFTFGFKK